MLQARFFSPIRAFARTSPTLRTSVPPMSFCMDASRNARTDLGVTGRQIADGQADCSFVSGLWCGAFCPLALMESADPRLICPVSFSPFNDIQAWRIAV